MNRGPAAHTFGAVTTPHPEGDHEELETIPWSLLSDELDRGRKPRALAITAGAAIVAAALGFVAVRTLGRPTTTTVEVAAASTDTTAAPASAAPDTPPPTEAASIDEPSTAPVTEAPPAVAPPAPALYSEADLMAVVPGDDIRVAAARAEWFVAEYFSTANPPGETGLPEGATPRRFPEGAYSWVEWARASAVAPRGEGLYDVTVVFRTLVREEDGTLAAVGPRAVAVPVLVDVEGAAGVVDLPGPAALPEPAQLEPLPAGTTDLPDEVVAVALGEVSHFGSDAEVVDGSQTGDGWRVVVSVSDRSGAGWPLVVRVHG